MKAREAIFPGFQTGWWCGFSKGVHDCSLFVPEQRDPCHIKCMVQYNCPALHIDDEVCLTLVAAQPNRGHLSPLYPNRMCHWPGLHELIKATFQSIFTLSKTMNWMFVAAENWCTVRNQSKCLLCFFFSAVWMWSKINPYSFAMVGHCW